MKFGIFYEHQLPRPWSADSEYRLLHESLAQIELADGLGYDYAWEVEHHFLEEYSHSSAPEVFLGAASQRTRRIRLGHGVIQLPTNHPIRVAERVATLDLLSGGRVELGLGEAQGPVELHPFGRRVRDKRDVWEEAVRALIPCFTQTSVEFHGRFFDFDDVRVIPKPMQQPHPPLWYGLSHAAGAEWSATNRVNVLANGPSEVSAPLFDRYREVWERKHGGGAMPKLGISRHVVVAATEARAEALARSNYAIWYANLTKLWRDLTEKSGTVPFPSLIYQDLNLAQRVLRDMATEETSRILVDSRETYQKMLDFAQQYTPTIVDRIHHYNGERPHRSRNLRPPASHSDPMHKAGGQTERANRLGGLLSDYGRVPVAA